MCEAYPVETANVQLDTFLGLVGVGGLGEHRNCRPVAAMDGTHMCAPHCIALAAGAYLGWGRVEQGQERKKEHT